jgi:hypothetical protein
VIINTRPTLLRTCTLCTGHSTHSAHELLSSSSFNCSPKHQLRVPSADRALFYTSPSPPTSKTFRTKKSPTSSLEPSLLKIKRSHATAATVFAFTFRRATSSRFISLLSLPIAAGASPTKRPPSAGLSSAPSATRQDTRKMHSKLVSKFSPNLPLQEQC